jgi:hypothetical protein
LLRGIPAEPFRPGALTTPVFFLPVALLRLLLLNRFLAF